jgi:hypothetical protein
MARRAMRKIGFGASITPNRIEQSDVREAEEPTVIIESTSDGGAVANLDARYFRRNPDPSTSFVTPDPYTAGKPSFVSQQTGKGIFPPGTRITIETPQDFTVSPADAARSMAERLGIASDREDAPDTTIDMETAGEVTTMETIPVTDVELGLAAPEPTRRWNWAAFLAGVAGGSIVGGFLGWFLGGDDKEEKK